MTRQELEQRIEAERHSQGIAEGVALVESARKFAIKAHNNQRYGDEPYSVHLQAVEDVLIEFNHVESVLRAAAWLHDVEEDTNYRTDEEFAGIVSLLVKAVTSEPGLNRKERNAKTYVKIKANPLAIILKLADRIANARNAKASNSRLFGMYTKEYPAFREALRRPGIIETDPMWEELDRIFA
jgi:(p)ppGpp synthase/HD superfamily hydrolase